jgi:hypothetical protein
MNNLRSAAILGLLLLAACSDDSHKKNTHLVVQNKSAEPVLVYVKYWADIPAGEYREDFTLAATSSVEYAFPESSKLEVKILRASDLLQLFLDSWTEKELHDLGQWVTVTLEP